MKEKMKKLLKGINIRITKEGLVTLGFVLICTSAFVVTAFAVTAIMNVLSEINMLSWLDSSEMVLIEMALCMYPALKVHTWLINNVK